MLAAVAAIAFNLGRASRADIYIKVWCETPTERALRTAPFYAPHELGSPSIGYES